MISFALDTDREVFLDALRFAGRQVRRLVDTHPDFYPMYTQAGRWKHELPAWTHWCDGFLPGMMWVFRQCAELTGDNHEWWKGQAIRYSKPLGPRQFDREVHDLGFIFFPTYYRWYLLTRDPALNQVLIQAGRTMAQRFKEKGQYLRSFVSDQSVFIDIMMNVGIIFYAAQETGDEELARIARQHCLTTRRVLVRGDGSTAHEGLFDLNTGEFLRQSTHQGYRSDSCWSRGLAWAMYGFSAAYHYTHAVRFLRTSEACADYYITRTPADGVPPWDYDAPEEQRQHVDTSAAAIAAGGLLLLSRQIRDSVKAHFYGYVARKILRTLCQNYLAASDPDWEGVLKGGVYHMHKGLGVNESVMWGEYFFVEALERVLTSPIPH